MSSTQVRDMLAYTTARGREVAAYRSMPTPLLRRAGVVLFHDWWGPMPIFRRIADNLAAQGYDTLVPDLYDGYAPTTPMDAMRRLAEFDIDAGIEDLIRGASGLLGNGSVGLVGFSLGGRVAMVSAARGLVPGVVISFYGIPVKGEARLDSLNSPAQLHLCRKDMFFRKGIQEVLAGQLQRANPANEIHWYDAKHGFFNDEHLGTHDPDAASRAWVRALAFLRAHLA